MLRSPDPNEKTFILGAVGGGSGILGGVKDPTYYTLNEWRGIGKCGTSGFKYGVPLGDFYAN